MSPRLRRAVQVLLLLVAGNAHPDDGLDAEGRDLKIAQNTILMRIMTFANPESRRLCAENRFACVGGDPGELAMALIAARDTPRSLSALTNLLRLRLDAAYAEGLDCYVLTKQLQTRPLLLRADPERLRAECTEEFERAVKSHRGLFDQVTIDQACATTAMIKAHIGDLLDAMDRNERCPF